LRRKAHIECEAYIERRKAYIDKMMTIYRPVNEPIRYILHSAKSDMRVARLRARYGCRRENETGENFIGFVLFTNRLQFY
jgi:hypothetical protein